jgi:hypothetical protein
MANAGLLLWRVFLVAAEATHDQDDRHGEEGNQRKHTAR